MRLMAIHQKTENQTAYSGVPVFLLTMTHMRESGIRRSREKAKTVRARACMAVKQTNWRTMKAETAKKMEAPLPREL